MKRGLVFSKYDVLAASTRQRIVQYVPYLEQAGITLDIRPLFDNAYLEKFFGQGKRSLGPMVHAYRRRLAMLADARDYDFVWVQYELFPYLPGGFEALISLAGKPVICDYDDAIFHQYDQHKNPFLRGLLGDKLQPLLRRADLALCGNSYLQEYVGRYCKRTAFVPTVLDVQHYVPQVKPAAAKPTVGWIGSPTTWRFCQPYVAMLAEMVKAGEISVLVVGAGHGTNQDLPFEFRDWSEAREVADIQAMDIGIMPAPDAPWARGKCGYKLIQYMACGLPVVASPIGVNNEIVTPGVNGFLATRVEEWREALRRLVADSAMRAQMGQAGRAVVEQRYSIQQYGPRVAGLVAEIC